MDLTLLPLEVDGLSIRPATEGRSLRFTWTGRSTARDPGASLVPYFLGALYQVAAGTTIEMDFQAVEYFNSSTIGSLIYLVEEARRQSVPLVFVYDRRLKWQELSFAPLRVLRDQSGLFQLRTA